VVAGVIDVARTVRFIMSAKTGTAVAKAAAAAKKLDLITATGLPRGFVVVGLTASERLSHPFEAYLELRPAKPAAFDLDAFAAALINKPVGVALRPSRSPADAVRHFHGEVAGVHLTDTADEDGAPHVVVELRPTLWRLARAADTRHFTGKTAKDVVSAVLDENGLAGKYRWHDAPGKVHAKREHCWQYRETHLRFVQRLLEEEGYLYWFTFGPGGHTLHLGGGPEHLPKVKGPLALGRIGPDAGVGGFVGSLRRSVAAAPAAYFVDGRSADGAARMPGSAAQAGVGAAGAVHDPDGALATVTDSKAEAARRLDACTAAARTADGLSDVRAVAAGAVVAIAGRAGGRAAKYRVVAVRHEATQDTGIYTNRFDAVPADAPFALPRRFPKPTVAGGAAATVAEGPNERGHYRLKFDLDRRATPSGWVPLTRETDGLFLPRPGHRVHVGFHEGDPDRPVIRHLTDPASAWPFDPAENPLLGGVVTPAHELLFQSDPAEPWVKLHARGDYEEVVEKGRHSATGADRTEVVGGAADWVVGKDANWTVAGAFLCDVAKAFGITAESFHVRCTKGFSVEVGGNFIAVTEKGVTINGTLVQLNPPGASKPDGPRPPRKKPEHEAPKPRPKKAKEGK
jgi:type VI secretion system secreted protein VgrG